jgi:hypothetical protein
MRGQAVACRRRDLGDPPRGLFVSEPVCQRGWLGARGAWRKTTSVLSTWGSGTWRLETPDGDAPWREPPSKHGGLGRQPAPGWRGKWLRGCCEKRRRAGFKRAMSEEDPVKMRGAAAGEIAQDIGGEARRTGCRPSRTGIADSLGMRGRRVRSAAWRRFSPRLRRAARAGVRRDAWGA